MELGNFTTESSETTRLKEFQALQKLCNLLHSLIKDFLMVCILQKIAEFLQSLEFFCTNLYNIVRLAEPFLHNQKKSYKAFTFCTVIFVLKFHIAGLRQHHAVECPLVRLQEQLGGNPVEIPQIDL
ncbi:hypothetical protein BpHYR1_011547 [Brachionus plicatilis]|uniref:Uncharacterized protein n=1 Tax=Brachionus plicatilis TaxID=10195 RepID=A0A3M7QZW2_BRAPC|nr:hypothetical protein BpHYR1_011547 [Brachionus plicatilis]